MGHEELAIIFFCIFVGASLGITVWANRHSKTATDYFAAGRGISGMQNGLAISGDYMSAASFLGIAGLIALFGFDGFMYSIGFLVGYLIVLLLVAELLRNSGRFTLADVLSFRLKQGPVRTAASVSTLTVSIFYLLAQMVGAGALVTLLLGIDSTAGISFSIIAVGALMIVYVMFGGMKATTWVQIIKACLLMFGTILLAVLVMNRMDWSITNLFNDARDASGKGDAFLEPGLRYSDSLDLVSLGLALVLGTAGLPHILMRFYTVPDSKTARKSVNWAIGIIGSFYVMTIFLGLGAAALVGSGNITAANKAGNSAAPLLAEELGGGDGSTGGAIMLAFISAVAFATILAVVAGLTLTASASFAHDFYARVIAPRRHGGVMDEDATVKMAKWTALVLGAIAIVLGILAREQNVAFLVGLAFAIAASANLPCILFSLFWRGFNTTGAVVGIYAGLVSSVGLVALGPAVLGPTGILSTSFEAPFPLENPGIVSIPVGFIAAWLGAMLTREPAAEAMHGELEVRALTGLGAE